MSQSRAKVMRQKSVHVCLQIRCGDLYNDKAIQTFTACAVSDKKCVPQKIDRDAFPEPKPELLDKNFDLGKFEVPLFLQLISPLQ